MEKIKLHPRTVSMTPEDEALIKRLRRALIPKHGVLSVTALVRLALRNMESK